MSLPATPVPLAGNREELQRLMIEKKVKLPPKMIHQLMVIWWAAYTTSLEEELPGEECLEFLERYLLQDPVLPAPMLHKGEPGGEVEELRSQVVRGCAH